MTVTAAARELDALDRLWQNGGFSLSEIDEHIGKLQLIITEQFDDAIEAAMLL